MVKFRDRTGDKIGSLIVIQRVLYPLKGVYWECQCVCGNRPIVRGNKLGRIKSCGCNQHHGKLHKTHGKSETRAYRTWNRMKTRCDTPHYKKRGIVVCEEWKDFINFYRDMGEPDDNQSLDRIDNNKGYYKENCRWTTSKVQQNNRSNNVLLTYNNRTQTMSQWCDELGLNYERVNMRNQAGLPVESILERGELKRGRKPKKPD